MTKKQIFNRAWELTKATGNTSHATFAIALTIAWEEARQASEPTLEQKVIAAGGKLWEKGEKKRLYLNSRELIALIFDTVSFYRSGMVDSATRKGERISNSQANGLVTDCETASVYYDYEDKQLHVRSFGQDGQWFLAQVQESL